MQVRKGDRNFMQTIIFVLEDKLASNYICFIIRGIHTIFRWISVRKHMALSPQKFELNRNEKLQFLWENTSSKSRNTGRGK